jgi:hypothetical protein
VRILPKSIVTSVAGLTIACASAPATATVITFDEFAPQNTNGAIPTNQYSYLGVTIQATDDGSTWGGLTNGDPGNWDLQGTNGANFSGFNGNSSTMSLLFASTITNISLDASRANGSVDGAITLFGYLNVSLTATNSVTFGAVNSWSTLGLTGLFDRVTITGTGTDYHPFGIDNLNFTVGGAVPEPATWAMMLLGFGGIGMAMRRSRKHGLKCA